MGTATAIYGGLFGALVGGSSYNIQGPTGALSPILAWYPVFPDSRCQPPFSFARSLSLIPPRLTLRLRPHVRANPADILIRATAAS